MKKKDKKINFILNCLKQCNFDNLYSYDYEEETDDVFYDQIVRPFTKAYGKDVSYETGASKGVLIPDNENFVIKIPFIGYTLEDIDGEEQYYSFLGASNANNDWDYCAVEAEITQYAEQEGVDTFFAKTIKIGEIEGYPIYIQEQATILNDIEDENMKIDYTSLDKYIDEHDGSYQIDTCPLWAHYALDFTNESAFNRLAQFCDKYEINDLHVRNVGFIGERPVLVDYSGFRD